MSNDRTLLDEPVSLAPSIASCIGLLVCVRAGSLALGDDDLGRACTRCDRSPTQVAIPAHRDNVLTPAFVVAVLGESKGILAPTVDVGLRTSFVRMLRRIITHADPEIVFEGPVTSSIEKIIRQMYDRNRTLRLCSG